MRLLSVWGWPTVCVPRGLGLGRHKGAMNPKLILPAGNTPVMLMGWLLVTFMKYLKVSTSGMGCFPPVLPVPPEDISVTEEVEPELGLLLHLPPMGN